MTEVNFFDERWKYTDLAFCDEVSVLENSTKPSDDLTELIRRKKQLEKDVCKRPCPENLTGSCKCYRKSSDAMTRHNNAVCAKIVGSVALACPESCCNGGAGCPEPARGGTAPPYDFIPRTVEDTVDASDAGENTQDNNYILLVVGAITSLFVSVSAYSVSGSVMLTIALLLFGTILSLYGGITPIRTWLKDNILLQNRNGSTSD